MKTGMLSAGPEDTGVCGCAGVWEEGHDAHVFMQSHHAIFCNLFWVQ